MAFQIYRIPCTPAGSAGAAEVIVTQAVRPGILRQMWVVYGAQPATTRVYVDQTISDGNSSRIWALVGGNTSASFIPLQIARSSANATLNTAGDVAYQPVALFGGIQVEVNLGDPETNGVIVFLLVETK